VASERVGQGALGGQSRISTAIPGDVGRDWAGLGRHPSAAKPDLPPPSLGDAAEVAIWKGARSVDVWIFN